MKRFQKVLIFLVVLASRNPHRMFYAQGALEAHRVAVHDQALGGRHAVNSGVLAAHDRVHCHILAARLAQPLLKHAHPVGVVGELPVLTLVTQAALLKDHHVKLFFGEVYANKIFFHNFAVF